PADSGDNENVKPVVALLAFVAVARAQSSWPASVAAESFEVKVIESSSAGVTTYASPHFLIASEIKLPSGVVRDLAAVFEATRAAVRAAPLGFDRAPEPRWYP